MAIMMMKSDDDHHVDDDDKGDDATLVNRGANCCFLHSHCHLAQDPSYNRHCEAETQNNRACRMSAILRIFGILQGS